MRPLILFLVCIFGTVSLPAGGDEVSVIKNPDVPVNKNAGRIIRLKEVMKIRGEHDDFFFKYPSKIKIASDGSFYVIDDKQFLRFDSTGRFLGNLHKVGEGPGETIFIYDYYFTKKGILIFSHHPSKIIETDMAGSLLNEYRVVRNRGITKNVGIYNDRFWIASGGLVDLKDNMKGIVDMKLQLGWETLDGKAGHTDLVFTETIYLDQQWIGEGLRRIMSNLVPAIFALAPDGNLFVSDSREYFIKQVGLDTGKILREFKRKYPRVPYRAEIEEKGKKRQLKIPSPEFFNDILKLLFHRENLWVFTSSIDKQKGILIDVYSRDGQYVDCFYLPLPQVNSVNELLIKTIAVSGEYLVTVEKDEEENPCVVKYMLVGL